MSTQKSFTEKIQDVQDVRARMKEKAPSKRCTSWNRRHRYISYDDETLICQKCGDKEKVSDVVDSQRKKQNQPIENVGSPSVCSSWAGHDFRRANRGSGPNMYVICTICKEVRSL